MKHVLILPLTLVAIILLFSCQEAKHNAVMDTSIDAVNLLENQQPAPSAENGNQQPISTGSQQQLQTDTAVTQKSIPSNKTIDWDKKIVRTATLKLEVKDFKQYNSSVHQAIRQLGGYIEREEQQFADERIGNSITIKIPVDQFDVVMNQLSEGNVKLLERKISVEDVTGQVVDVNARLQTKRQMRLHYLELLKQAKNMEELLQVQAEINSLQEEIEAAAGRVAFLIHESAMSTVHLDFYQPVIGFQPDGASPSFITRLLEAFSFGGRWILELLLALVGLWPVLIVAGASIFIYRRRAAAKKLTV